MLHKVFMFLVLSAIVLPVSAQAKFFGLNEEEVKAVVKEYLINNPEIIKEALDNYAIREEEMRKKAAVAKLSSHRVALERDPETPFLGDPNGDVTIVEFFDYNCGYCKLMFPKVLEYVQNDGHIRWVLKDLPSLGHTSDLAARAGLAARRQGKYFEMHQSMITHQGALTETDILSYARMIGLDMEKFESDRKDPAFDKILEANRTLAAQFEFLGIPDFIIGDYISQGAMMGDEMEVNVAITREAAGKTEK